jgi:hypothetical protein
MPSESRRIRREKTTVEAMIRIYCRDHHQSSPEDEPQCRELLEYAFCRLDRCPFGSEKPTCADCPIHCYRKDMKQRIHEMMRYAGPRMIWRHPYLAVMHLIDKWRERPAEDES